MNAKTEILQKFVRENLRNWFKKEKWKRIDTQGNIKRNSQKKNRYN